MKRPANQAGQDEQGAKDLLFVILPPQDDKHPPSITYSACRPGRRGQAVSLWLAALNIALGWATVIVCAYGWQSARQESLRLKLRCLELESAVRLLRAKVEGRANEGG